MEKVPTGLRELDGLLGGGLPKGGIVLVAGGPGTGKTILGTQFLYQGATLYGESGVFVSFGESSQRLRDFMTTLGWDFDKLIGEKKIAIMDLVVARTGAIDAIVDMIMDKVRETEAKRLVIDSITAISLASEKRIDSRILVTLLHKALEKAGCTTLLITETPWGSSGIGTGVEEFVADGIILMETFLEGAEYKRRLAIIKMRGTDHDTRRYKYSIVKGDGISIIPYPEASTPR
jgi:circadian clock protein KaiC